MCVQSLSLDGNQLTFLYTQAFHGIGGLLSLALQNNNISFLEGRSLFSNLNQLTTLSLQRNQLPRIPAGTFDGLVSLTYIDLSRNKLRSLPGAVLRRSTKLRHVYLDDNQLDMIDSCILAPHHSLSAATTRTLSVLGNPINCDCTSSRPQCGHHAYSLSARQPHQLRLLTELASELQVCCASARVVRPWPWPCVSSLGLVQSQG